MGTIAITPVPGSCTACGGEVLPTEVTQGTVPWVVSGTVALDAGTLAALETVTVLQGTSPWVVSGTVTANPTPSTINAQHRLVADADAAWTPGTDVVGTLVSVTFTVFSGTATVLDQSGTSASLPTGFSGTWSAADGNTLLGPGSIDAIGGSTYVAWTQR